MIGGVIMDEKIIFGQKLLELRKKSRKSQAEIAQLLGITTSAYQNYENGRREAGYATISKLAQFYNVSTDYLLGVEEQKNPFAGLNIKISDKPFIEAYKQLPDDAKQLFILIMEKLAAAAQSEPDRSEEPEIVEETTVGAVLDRSSADEEESAV